MTLISWKTVEVQDLWPGEVVQGFGQIVGMDEGRSTNDLGYCGDPDCCSGTDNSAVYSWIIRFKSGYQVEWDSDREVLACGFYA